MAARNEKMILSASIMGLGMHLGAWMAREGKADDFLSMDLYSEVARVAESCKLHALFLADPLTNAEEGTDRPALGALDPLVVLAAMATATSRIGLVGTASTTYSEPYDLARRFATLDHLTGGRAGWNAVATFVPAVAEMFGGRQLPDRDRRYARAEEFMSVALKLWDSWEEGALVGDKVNGVFADASKVHQIGHTGEFFSVKGPLPLPRTPQGRPVIFQAGSSPEGRAQAAKYADVVFTAHHIIEDGISFRDDIRERALRNGRDPDQIKVLPGLSLILGSSEDEALDRKSQLDGCLGTGPELLKLARRVGLSPDVLELDKPFPVHLIGPDEEFSGSIGFRRSLVNLAVKERLTVRQLISRYGGGHQQIIGTASKAADVMQEWFERGAADGFNIMVDIVPSGFHDVANLLVPELQSRGLFHDDYEHDKLRDNLGLDRPRSETATKPYPVEASASAC